MKNAIVLFDSSWGKQTGVFALGACVCPNTLELVWLESEAELHTELQLVGKHSQTNKSTALHHKACADGKPQAEEPAINEELFNQTRV